MRRNHHYQDRVNRVLDYIAGHLDSELSLARLSRIGCFSPFHFHRIFQGVTGETLNSHVRRVRLERAAVLLKASPRKRITDVALETGFAGTAEFSRAFKNHFDRTASSWDRRSPLEKSKICKAPEMLPFHTIEELQRWKTVAKNIRVRVQRCNGFRYVYSRNYEPYGNTGLVDRYHALTAWLAERRTDIRDVVVIGMSLDDPSSRLPRIAATISASPSRGSRAAYWAISYAREGWWQGVSRRCRPDPNATREALASAISRPGRLPRCTATEILAMWIARGTICIVSGFRQAVSSRRIYRQWRCLCGYRRK